ncbi:D-2-hydroxyacid dehydrogenase [Salinimonas lutimaris]|uniref:D-2-hydroxyacid dehydrogenase n=1 Tax=Salinimonas lutimaris TaxID=914153 RepID=UPI0010C138A1|nr:D-2-hydroxyacid dehydrogenase [Salinimonas lutimaris]
MTTPTPVDIVILSHEYRDYARELKNRSDAPVNVVAATDRPDTVPTEGVEVLLGDPDLVAQVIGDCPKLRWVQSGWAGNAPLINHTRQDYILTGVKGVFAMQMREYVFAHLLYFSRNIAGFTQAAGRLQQKWHKPDFYYLAGKTLGICGAGSIAEALVPVAHAFGMQVIGLSRSGQPKAGFAAMYTAKDKTAFASQCDFLVSLMPDTPQTSQFIDETLLAALPAQAVLINAGRGSAIVQSALLDALDTGHLRAAVLDVFEQEPLADDHPFWSHPAILVTQHTAAASRPQDIISVFTDNLKRYQTGQSLHYIIDFEKGY